MTSYPFAGKLQLNFYRKREQGLLINRPIALKMTIRALTSQQYLLVIYYTSPKETAKTALTPINDTLFTSRQNTVNIIIN
jgi:hypothetical protein